MSLRKQKNTPWTKEELAEIGKSVVTHKPRRGRPAGKKTSARASVARKLAKRAKKMKAHRGRPRAHVVGVIIKKGAKISKITP